MGKVIIQSYTPKDPLNLIGIEAGCCWGTDTTDTEKNIKRGRHCVSSDHGRVLEYPQVYIILEGYSARVIREFYTHIGGAPTRLQASTRRIDYTNMDTPYVIPSNLSDKDKEQYKDSMDKIFSLYKEMCSIIPLEDAANLLPLGMTTTVCVRTNLRNLVDMAHQRLCKKTYLEYRELMEALKEALSDYSPEWKELIDMLFVPKCIYLGHCPEKVKCTDKE